MPPSDHDFRGTLALGACAKANTSEWVQISTRSSIRGAAAFKRPAQRPCSSLRASVDTHPCSSWIQAKRDCSRFKLAAEKAGFRSQVALLTPRTLKRLNPKISLSCQSLKIVFPFVSSLSHLSRRTHTRRIPIRRSSHHHARIEPAVASPISLIALARFTQVQSTDHLVDEISPVPFRQPTSGRWRHQQHLIRRFTGEKTCWHVLTLHDRCEFSAAQAPRVLSQEYPSSCWGQTVSISRSDHAGNVKVSSSRSDKEGGTVTPARVACDLTAKPGQQGAGRLSRCRDGPVQCTKNP